tara:strand:+ start:1163 stop:1504 length:342 start_codon:yes stop_codon:yes gene_type:complete
METSKGIGIDIESVTRFEKLPFEENRSFYEKVFTPKEIKYCISTATPAEHFAARWCAKEAVIKAINEKIAHNRIEIVKEGKKPKIRINGKDTEVLISISHTRKDAMAIALTQK